jgi:glycine cleavage system transcriptional repressor
VNEYAVTVIGHDRPGIIADVAEILARLGLNLTDSSMTLLRGHFAMTLICAGPPRLGEVEAALDPLAKTLVVSVRELAPEAPPAEPGTPYVLTVHGADRLGIVAALTRTLAEAGGNITDLTTRLAGDLYLLIAEVDLPSQVDADALHARLRDVAARLGVEAALRPAEVEIL